MLSTTRCIICVMPIFSFNLSALQCGHTFHLRCIMTWLTNSISCPICRREISIRDPVKPLFIRERTRDRYARNRYPAALHYMYQNHMNKLSVKEIQAAYFSEGIALQCLIQKYYDFEVDTTLWEKAIRCPMCLLPLLSKDTYSAPCGHSLHIQCFEKWKNIDSECQVCRKKAVFENMDNDLLRILTEETPSLNRDNSNEAERESDKLLRENTTSHLKIIRAVMLLDTTLKL